MTERTGHLRAAEPGDVDRLLALWEVLYDDAPEVGRWRDEARRWLVRITGGGDDHDRSAGGSGGDRPTAYVRVVDVDGEPVACAVGTLELGVPNPYSPTGRAVRLADLVTHPQHRGRGYATALVAAVVDWARSVGADRVDLSATPEGLRLYERAGFVRTNAPRLKLVLDDGTGAEVSSRKG